MGLALQIADSGKPIAEISLPLQFKGTCSGMPVSTISQQWEVYCHKKSENWFPGEYGKTFSHEMSGLSAISYM
jgi:hypothetical protein